MLQEESKNNNIDLKYNHDVNVINRDRYLGIITNETKPRINDDSSITQNRMSSIETSSIKSLPSNHINFTETMQIFQPRLLKLKKSTNKIRKQPDMDDEYLLRKTEIKNKMKQMAKVEKQMKKDEHINYNTGIFYIINMLELKEKVTSFYKNPFEYMDYLIEKYCKSQITY